MKDLLDWVGSHPALTVILMIVAMAGIADIVSSF